MKITEKEYEAAWEIRKAATAEFKAQLNKELAAARTLPSGGQRKAAIAAADKYDDACEPAVKIWQRALGVE